MITALVLWFVGLPLILFFICGVLVLYDDMDKMDYENARVTLTGTAVVWVLIACMTTYLCWLNGVVN